MASIYRSGVLKKSNESTRVIGSSILGITFGFLLGISFPSISLTKLNLAPHLVPTVDLTIIDRDESGEVLRHFTKPAENRTSKGADGVPKIYATTNPRGAEVLPPGIVVPESDFYLRRLWGDPDEDLTIKPRYLLTLTVGFEQRNNIDLMVKKFSENFTILLFHYDGRASEWEDLEWSQRAIHVSVKRQSKWWNVKRFLHPDIVAAYDYIFVWDEDLGVENFNAEKYIQLVAKHGLEISQPGIEPNGGVTRELTKKRWNSEVHKETAEQPGWCSDPHLPPCAAFVDIMAPVFSRNAWRCVWHMIQNDLVHGWGLDFAMRRCIEPAHEKIGVVDSQWITHKATSLQNQAEPLNGMASWEGVRERSKYEQSQFEARLANADRSYFARREQR